MCFTTEKCHHHQGENGVTSKVDQVLQFYGTYGSLPQKRGHLQTGSVRYKRTANPLAQAHLPAISANGTYHVGKEKIYTKKQGQHMHTDHKSFGLYRKSQEDFTHQPRQMRLTTEVPSNDKSSMAMTVFSDQTHPAHSGIDSKTSHDAEDGLTGLLSHERLPKGVFLTSQHKDNVTDVKQDRGRRGSVILLVDKATGDFKVQPVWFEQSRKYPATQLCTSSFLPSGSRDRSLSNQNTQSGAQPWQSLKYLRYRPFKGRIPAVMAPGSPEYEAVKGQMLSSRKIHKKPCVWRNKKTQTGRGTESYTTHQPVTHFHSAYRFTNGLNGKQWIVLPPIRK